MNFKFNEKDYMLLEDIFNESDEVIREKLLDLSIWQEADMKESEVNIGNSVINFSMLICSVNNKIKTFKVIDRKAKKGEMIYITDSSPSLGDWAIGKCYISGGVDIFGGVKINASDTYSGTGGYSVLVRENQYVILEEVK